MDHFESVICTLLEGEGYWVRRSYKVEVTKDEKRRIGTPSMPRPEIDVVALHFAKNEVLAFEAKSFLDSPGVRLSSLQEKYERPQGGYKLFTSDRYREIVFVALKRNLVARGMANADTRILLGLAAGKVYQGQSGPVRELLERRGWLFWSPEDIKRKVIALAERGYENDVATITAKILRN